MKCRTCAMTLRPEEAFKTPEGKFCHNGCHQWWLGYEGGKQDGYKKGRDAAYADGLDRGIEIAVGWFWKKFTLDRAHEAFEEAGSLAWDAESYPQMNQKTREWYKAESLRKEAEARQLRKWASE